MSDSTSVPDIQRLHRSEDDEVFEATIEVAAAATSREDFMERMDQLNLPVGRRALTSVRAEVRRRNRATV